MKRRHIIMASKSAKRLLVNKVIETFVQQHLQLRPKILWIKTSSHNETQIYKKYKLKICI